MQCEEFETRVNDLLDRRASLDADPQLHAHLEACAACCALADAYGVLLLGMHPLVTPPVPADLAARVVRDLNQRDLKQRDLGAAVEPSPSVTRPYSVAGAMLALAASMMIAVVALPRSASTVRRDALRTVAEAPAARELVAAPIAQTASGKAAPVIKAPVSPATVSPTPVVEPAPVNVSAPATAVASGASTATAAETALSTAAASPIAAATHSAEVQPAISSSASSAVGATAMTTSVVAPIKSADVFSPTPDLRGEKLYNGVAKMTGRGLASAMRLLPGMGGKKPKVAATTAPAEKEPAWTEQMTEGFKPVTHSVTETINLLLLTVPRADKPGRS